MRTQKFDIKLALLRAHVQMHMETAHRNMYPIHKVFHLIEWNGSDWMGFFRLSPLHISVSARVCVRLPSLALTGDTGRIADQLSEELAGLHLRATDGALAEVLQEAPFLGPNVRREPSGRGLLGEGRQSTPLPGLAIGQAGLVVRSCGKPSPHGCK